jgi:hypothetical protein
MIFLSDKELSQFYLKAMHIGKTLTSTTIGMKLYHSMLSILQQTQHKHMVGVGWYSKNTLQLKFRNSVELARVVGETLKIIVNTKDRSPVGESIKEFPKPDGTYRIIKNIR